MIPAEEAEEMTLEVRRTVGLWLIAGHTIADMCEALGARPPPPGKFAVDYVIHRALLAWLRLSDTKRAA